MRCQRSIFLCLLATATPASGVTPLPAPPLVPRVNAASLDALAASLKSYLVQAIPDPLLEVRPGWGNQARTANGVKWRGQGLHVHPEVQYTYKNDGNWRRLVIRATRLPSTFHFNLNNFQQPEHAPATFDVCIAFDADVAYERQTWSTGMRVYAGSIRARLRVIVKLKCEVKSRLEKGDALLPDVLFRLRVLKADLGYDNLVVEHVAGLGGEVAKFLGEVVQSVLRFNPDWERSLLARANAAIVKAADTKEVRVSLSKLLPR